MPNVFAFRRYPKLCNSAGKKVTKGRGAVTVRNAITGSAAGAERGGEPQHLVVLSRARTAQTGWARALQRQLQELQSSV